MTATEAGDTAMLVIVPLLKELERRPARSIEDVALQFLALRRTKRRPVDILSAQLPCGAWSNQLVTAVPNAYSTALALIALAHAHPAFEIEQAVNRGFAWLEKTEGREGHWLWQWKFRLFDRHVRFDPRKFGWPWVEGTVSWVAPTAAALLAYAASRRQSRRLPLALAMLEDRACAGGGWNAGNGRAFNVHLDPHPDFSAMAVCALASHGSGETSRVGAAVRYLAERLSSCRSAYSLAWGVLSLQPHDAKNAERLRHSLQRVLQSEAHRLSTATLSLAALAVETPAFQWLPKQ